MEVPEGREQVRGGPGGGFAPVFAGQNTSDSQQTTQSLSADPGPEPPGEALLFKPFPLLVEFILLFTCANTHNALQPHQKQQSVQLRESFNKAQNALQSCDNQLAQLRAQSEEVLRRVMGRQQVQDR